ncbi:hypothetical protein A0U40_17615 [[Bacillus] sp. KCTC 13219]|nr:hypothetical protein A0U40_17615 [[Bacillus] sp. KCTC 13219]
MDMVLKILSRIKNSASTVTPILTAFIGLINLGLVIWFFMSNKSYQIRKHLADIDYYWFRKYVLEENNQNIHDCFKNMISKCDEIAGKNDDIVSEGALYIRENITKLLSDLGDPLLIIAPHLKVGIESDFEAFEDTLVELLIDSIEKTGSELIISKSKISNVIKKQKVNTLGKMYSFEKHLFK